MHELVWNSTGFQIVRGEKPLTDPGPPPAPTEKTISPTRPKSKPIDRELWKNFVNFGKADLSCIKKPIRDSWQRCHNLGVDPAFGKCQDICDIKKLAPETRLLCDLVTEAQPHINNLIRKRGLIVTISNPQGYLINMFGDYRALICAEKLNFGPGANWSEASVGTNAIGTALASGVALTVSGLEHFCEGHQSWICSAAPIFDLSGTMIGCIDISGPTTSIHNIPLPLAINGARIIESQLLKKQANELKQQSVNLVTSAFNAVATGMMVLDPNGIIKTVNPTAAVLLNMSQESLIGCSAQICFEIETALERLKKSPEIHATMGVTVKWKQRASANARVYPITTPNGSLGCLLLVLYESQNRPHMALPMETKTHDPFNAVIGVSSAILSAVETAKQVAPQMTSILITGESGTGKEIMAKALHRASPRAQKPFVAINCGAIPHELIQSELFGYAQGAFTGANRGGNPGKFEQANEGTLFLDEIAEMPLDLQVNLLRVLEENSVTRVGGNHPIPVDVRILSATSKNLKELILQKTFREDLYYRLKVVKIDLPPLRQRGRDMDLLAEHFINQLSKELNQTVKRVDPSFYRSLHNHTWPGNVRELKHAIEGAIALMSGDTLFGDALCDSPGNLQETALSVPDKERLNLMRVEKETIQLAYARFSGNISHTAKALGIGRNTLYAKLLKYKIT
ncbi:Signal-transduction and transcriptional-control protein [Desulforapulum autotrophicum HRM2]|uniref:Signal-transduction and transcriptional-control protein n=1 Tax=Desulforapulum autotrophicum (strain ATCC 43914 / DSM 3382 / VKM B-1955 / HRM2) TaxID=177437 RepID=C0QHF5_DESAH|nr:sigma-54-dependent Fis family transcriptional regulator [Desulforapulum autotrophicum]ACN17814.1 Signal-transduction and transcriptional-control protein [Desulforapulum autotrophicum HRM2]